MTTQKPDFYQTNEIIHVPLAISDGFTFTDLTAPQMRLAITLTSLAFENGRGVISIDKPRLQAISGVRLDNADRVLDPVFYSKIDTDHADIAGQTWFEEISYVRGERHKTAGIITARLSTAGMNALLSAGRSYVDIHADELGRYNSIYSVILRLRLGAMITASEKMPRLRLRADEILSVFRSYAGPSLIKRDVSYGEKSYVSLSKAREKMLAIAVMEINDLCMDFQISLVELRDGPRIAAIDIVARRLTKRVTIEDLAARERYRNQRLAERVARG